MTQDRPETMLRLRDLRRSFRVRDRALPAFAGVNAEFPRGSITAIVGPSGCGKTTLIRSIAGLIEADSGSIDPAPPAASVIFQDFGLLPWKTVRANAELPLLLAGRDRAARARACDPILEELGLLRFAGLFPSRLSGGMRQRVAVARALVARDDLLLMDEPFSSLDEMTRETLQDLLLEVRRRHGTTVIIVTHSVDEAAYLADRVYVMEGRNPGTIAAKIDRRGDRDRVAQRDTRSGAERGFAAEIRRALAEGTSGAGSRSRAAAPVRQPDAEEPARRPGGIRTFAGKLLRMGIAAAALLALWASLAALLRKPFLPAPAEVARTLADLASRGALQGHLLASFRRVLLSLAAAGPAAWALGILAGRAPRAGAILSPFMFLFHPLPKVAFLPILLMFFGLGDASKVALMALVIFGQFFVSARDAARGIPPPLVESVYSLGKRRGAVLRHVVLPGTLPELFSAVRVSLGTAIAVLFLSETFASMDGLGWLIMDAWSRVEYREMYAAIVTLSLFGLGLFVAADALEAWICRWRHAD